MLYCTASYILAPSKGGVRRATVIGIKSNPSSSPDMYPQVLNFFNDESTLNIHFQSGCIPGGDPNSVTLKMTGDNRVSAGTGIDAGEKVEIVVLVDPASKKFIAVAAKPNGKTIVEKGEMKTNVAVSGVGYAAQGGVSTNSLDVTME